MVTIDTFIGICQRVATQGPQVYDRAKKKLLFSDREKELLILAERADGYMLYNSEEHGWPTYIQVGERRLADPHDSLVSEEFLEAFRSLCEKGLVRFEKFAYFRLSAEGIRKARELQEEYFLGEESDFLRHLENLTKQAQNLCEEARVLSSEGKIVSDTIHQHLEQAKMSLSHAADEAKRSVSAG